jgi:hypothetical protein
VTHVEIRAIAIRGQGVNGLANKNLLRRPGLGFKRLISCVY